MEAPGTRKLVVEVVEAKELIGSPCGGVYCGAYYDEQWKTTTLLPSYPPPTWNEKFEFVLKSITTSQYLLIRCYTQVNGSDNIESGSIWIPVVDVPERPGAEPDDLRWYRLQTSQNQSAEGSLKLRIWIKREDQELQSILETYPQVPSQPLNLGHTENLEHLTEGEGSSTAGIQSDQSRNPFLPGPSRNSHDVPEPANTTNMLESMQGETEQVINERMVAREAHLQKVKDLLNAQHSHVVEAFDLEARKEWQIQETLTPCASQLVAQSLQRKQSMVASKQTLENFGVPNYLIPSIDDAMDKEQQLVQGVTYAARDSVKQQKQLRDDEQSAFQAYLSLLEKQKKEQMELFKTLQQEKERHLNRWAIRRREIQKIVRSIESNSQVVIQQLNTLVETSRPTREYMAAIDEIESDDESIAEVRRAFEKGMKNTSDSSHVSDCQICYNYLEGPSWKTSMTTSSDVKQRSCLIPCNHAMICLPCAIQVWESTKVCPFCKVTLTIKPCPLYLG